MVREINCNFHTNLEGLKPPCTHRQLFRPSRYRHKFNENVFIYLFRHVHCVNAASKQHKTFLAIKNRIIQK